MPSRNVKQQDQDSIQLRNAQPGIGGAPQPPMPPGPGTPREPQALQRESEEDPADVTLFRTGNFFVHAFSPQLRTGTLRKVSKDVGNVTLLERIRWTSAEKQRLIEAQTRLLPDIDTFNVAQWREIAIPAWLEGLVIALVLCATFVVQAFSLFNYPAYSPDEGNYMSNAWALIHGQIAPYVYTYDQPPIGWIQIAGWLQLTGGIASFGNAINSGRILMLVLATASSLLLYLITSRMSGSRSAALLAMIIYTLSPLSLTYRHEILLDNIGTFWLLLSLCLITTGKSRLGTFALAAASLGIAILTKEVFLIFIPVMLYAVSLYATQFQRKFSLVVFLYITLATASALVLLALLKGELLPAGSRPSLIGALLQQLQAPMVSGQFSMSWNTWMQTDMVFLVAGIAAIFINILGGTVNRFQLLAALFAVTFCIFLLSSRVVYPFTIVPLLPFLALNIAMALNTPLRWLTRRAGFDLARAFMLFILIGLLIAAGIQQAQPLLATNATQPQQQAMVWLRDNTPHNAVVITNSYLYTDLHDPQGMGVGGGQPFAHAEVYWEAARDPAIADGELHENWQSIDFLVVDVTMLKEFRDDRQYALLNRALHHAIWRVSFGSSTDGTLIQVYQVWH